MSKTTPTKTRITKEEIKQMIYKKFPSLRCFPTTWIVNGTFRGVPKQSLLDIANELGLLKKHKHIYNNLGLCDICKKIKEKDIIKIGRTFKWE